MNKICPKSWDIFSGVIRSNRKKKPPDKSREVKGQDLEELLDAIGGSICVGRDGDGEVDLVGLAKRVTPIQECLGLSGVVAHGDLVKAVDKDMSDIVIAGVETTDKALEIVVSADGIVAGLNQTNSGLYVVYQLGTLFNADNVAGLVVDGFVDRINHLLGLTGAH